MLIGYTSGNENILYKSRKIKAILIKLYNEWVILYIIGGCR
jgi:hypothetical protein